MANTHSIDLEYDSTQYLKISDANQTGLDITGDISIEAWVKIEATPDHTFAIAAKWGAAGSRAYIFRLESSKMNFLYSGDGTSYMKFTADTALNVGQWYHVAVTVDVSAETCTFYLDGSDDGSTTNVDQNQTSIYNNSLDFTIGVDITSQTLLFDGLIDDVRVWNDIRTSGEISDNMSTELVGDEAGLAGYWKLNNDLLDATSNNNDLTAVNSPVFSTDIPFAPATGPVNVKTINGLTIRA